MKQSAVSFGAVRSRISTDSDVRHGDLADQASAHTGGLEIAVTLENASRAKIIQRRIFFERRMLGIQDQCLNEDCENTITERRRKAEPYAVLCKDCQDAEEKES